MDLTQPVGIMLHQSGLTTRRGWSYLHTQPVPCQRSFFRPRSHPMSVRMIEPWEA